MMFFSTKKGVIMELELWSELSAAISGVASQVKLHPRDTYPTALIVRVQLWSALHDRPTVWGCEAKNWTRQTCPEQLPDQSTMSRRTHRKDFNDFLELLGKRLNGKVKPTLLKIVDGKPLELPNHSGDPDARWGRGVSRLSLGYKLHMIYSGNPMPDSFVITPLNVCEKQMARRMLKRVKGQGYLLADALYDASWLFDLCRYHHHQLVCPRIKPGTALGHGYQSPQRLRCLEMLEPPAGVNAFGLSLHEQRTNIERNFSQMACFGGGLASLPPWVRTIHRVRCWVRAKLLINAARIRVNRSCAA
jgi:Transposase DDE domain